MNAATVGKWAFIIGLVIAVLAGLFFQPTWAIWVLAILGVIVGLINVTAEETRGFLLASIALTLSATALNTIPVVGCGAVPFRLIQIISPRLQRPHLPRPQCMRASSVT